MVSCDEYPLRKRIKKIEKNGNTVPAEETFKAKTSEKDNAISSDKLSRVSDDSIWFREDVTLWLMGIAFISLLTALVFVMGEARSWEALSGYSHNTSQSAQERFLPEPYIPEIGVRGRYGPDAPGRWYYWKLKPDMITFWTRFFPWAGYLSHQVLIWAVVYTNQNIKNEENLNKRFSTKVSSFNVIAFVGNMLFHLLHLLNTHVTYDALAQDTSIAASQSSVVVILIFIIVMEYPDRGLLFGWPASQHHTSTISKFFTLSSAPSKLIKKYHGYAFAWAAVYTYWYHPMENTWGHLTGAFYTWIVLLQGSLIYTKLHLNLYWRQFLEAWVVIHAGVVAAQTGGPEMMGTRLWPMFTFGFAMTWIITQIFSLSEWQKLPGISKMIPFTVFVAITTWAYSWIPDRQGRTWVRMPEVLRLPLTIYLYFVIAWTAGRLLLCLQPILMTGMEMIFGGNKGLRRLFMVCCAVAMYVVHFVLAIWAEYGDLKMRLTAMSLIFDAIFIIGCTMSFIFLDEAAGTRRQ